MSCGICGRREASGSCNDGFVAYLSGDYPCVFNKTAAGPRNLRELPPLKLSRAVHLSEEGTQTPDKCPEREVVRSDDPAPEMRDSSSEVMSSAGLEDLL